MSEYAEWQLKLLVLIMFFQTSSSSDALTLSDLEERGAVRAATVWRWNDDESPKTIHVCWEDESTDEAQQRSLVRDAIENTWQLYTQLEFVGWNACTDGVSGIRILVADIQPMLRYPYIGKEIDGMPRGMKLNFTFEHFDSDCKEGTKKDWIARIAVHEFGHAIGFTHEQNRADTPLTCTALKQGTLPDKNLTHWDAKSIMNYCYCAGDAELSSSDIEAAQALYGKR